MVKHTTPGVANPASGQTPQHRAALLDVHEVAALLSCSVRHVHRLARSGRMPAALRVGSLVRWDGGCIRAWIDTGCPAAQRGGTADP